jgi:hypothetical protein
MNSNESKSGDFDGSPKNDITMSSPISAGKKPLAIKFDVKPTEICENEMLMIREEDYDLPDSTQLQSTPGIYLPSESSDTPELMFVKMEAPKSHFYDQRAEIEFKIVPPEFHHKNYDKSSSSSSEIFNKQFESQKMKEQLQSYDDMAIDPTPAPSP